MKGPCTRTTYMEINCAITDSIADSEPLETNPPRSEVLYTTRRRIWIAYYKSEEDLDHLLQVGEGPASIHRMVPIPADYSDFINNAIPSPNGHHSLMAPQSW
jgi:hypothetical protein